MQNTLKSFSSLARRRKLRRQGKSIQKAVKTEIFKEETTEQQTWGISETLLLKKIPLSWVTAW